VKVARCRSLGANVVVHGSTFDEAQAHALGLAAAQGATHVHPFDDLNVIAGQGTMALEIVEQAPACDVVVVPVGGGGLLAGTATVMKALRPRARVVAVEPARAASFLAARIAGEPVSHPPTGTVADGLAVSRVGRTTLAIAAPLVDDVVTVSEDELRGAIALLARAGVVAEGAGAAALGAVLAGKIRGGSVVVPVTGRNIDPRVHAEIVARPSWPPVIEGIVRAA
jgi:threonine dehydratase